MVKKAVIPAAGLGTRFLPVTKTLPKEMLPIIDIPSIELIVLEAINSGITDILIIVSSAKHAIENHFDYNYELEQRLLESGKVKEREELRKIVKRANIHFIRQKEPLGLGHAILQAKSFVGNDPFVVLLGDDVVKNDEYPCTRQLIDLYNKEHKCILGVQSVAKDQVSKYGIISPTNIVERVCTVESIVEKPKVEVAPSTLAVLGRYLFTPDIFYYIENTKPGKGGEIQITDAIEKMCKDETVLAYDFIGLRYDIGDKFGFLKAQIDYALERNDLREQMIAYIKELSSKL